jgi:hypothetical protein
MKKSIIFLAIIASAFVGCKKDPDTVSRVVTVSYPTITLNGDAIISQPIGTGTYVDAGATGTDDLTGATTTLSPVSNDVDLTQAGFYTVVYTTTNANGYITTATRFVLVTGVPSTDDWSGLWQRNADPTRPANLSKVGTGLYIIDNVGGVILPDQAPALAAYIGFVNDSTVEIPSQVSPTDGATVVAATEGVFYITATDTVMAWRMTAGPFATTNTRTFYKAH